jgi:hypothetical protein
MYDILFFASLIAGWIVLNVWILPLFGIHTCMSGACRVPRVEQDASPNTVGPAARVTKAERE